MDYSFIMTKSSDIDDYKDIAERLASDGEIKRSTDSIPHVPQNSSNQTKSGRVSPRRGATAKLLISTCLILVFLSGSIVGFSQQSMPGEQLYDIKRWSEDTAVRIVPAWKDDVALRRSSEIKTLINDNNQGETIEQALQDYKQAVDNVQPQTTTLQTQTTPNVAPVPPPSPTLERSLQNLQEAVRKAPNEVQQQNLNQVIHSTEKQLNLPPTAPIQLNVPNLKVPR